MTAPGEISLTQPGDDSTKSTGNAAISSVVVISPQTAFRIGSNTIGEIPSSVVHGRGLRQREMMKMRRRLDCRRLPHTKLAGQPNCKKMLRKVI